MRTTTKTTFASLAVTGGLAFMMATPAQAAVPTDKCGAGTTFIVTADDAIDALLIDSVRDALSARGLASTEGQADLVAVIAPASQIVDGGDASVMAVSLSTDDLDTTKAVEGVDWAPALWADGATPINTLLDDACGPVSSPAPAGDALVVSGGDAGPSAVTAPSATPAAARLAAPAAAPAAPAAPPAAAPVAAPAAPPAAPPAQVPAAASAAVPAAPPAAPPAQVPAAAPAAPPAAVPAASNDSATVDVGASTTKLSVSGADKDCADFSSQAAAQAFFTTNGGPAVDPHRLDRDKDGIACESHFAGEETAPRPVEARTINAGVPDASGSNALGLVGGVLLALSGLGVAARARRLA